MRDLLPHTRYSSLSCDTTTTPSLVMWQSSSNISVFCSVALKFQGRLLFQMGFGRISIRPYFCCKVIFFSIDWWIVNYVQFIEAYIMLHRKTYFLVWLWVCYENYLNSPKSGCWYAAVFLEWTPVWYKAKSSQHGEVLWHFQKHGEKF